MQIFISYSSQDRRAIESLADDLTALGYDVWLDQELTGGHSWWEQILANIQACDLFIFALTQIALDSVPCQREYGYAHALQKRILPVLIGDVDDIRILPPALQSLQFVDYRQRTPDAALKLGRALSKLPSAFPLPHPLPPTPPTPLSPLAYAAERVNVSTLTPDEQKSLMFDLRELLDDSDTAQSARKLLEKLRSRDDLLARVEKDITALLLLNESHKLMKSPSTVSTHRYEARVFEEVETWIGTVAFAPDGSTILTGGDDGIIRVWDIYSGKIIRKIEVGDIINSITYTPNGQQIISGSNAKTVQLWDAVSGQAKGHFDSTDVVSSVISSRSGQSLLIASHDGVICLRDLLTGVELRYFEGHKGIVYQAVFSPDEKFVVSGGLDRTMRMWDAVTGQGLIFSGHDNSVYSVDFSPNGQHLVTGSEDMTSLVLSLNPLRQVHVLPHPDEVWVVKVSPNSQMLITGCDDGIARLWNITSGELIYPFRGHTEGITSAAFSPDGRAILTGSGDGTARLWPLDGII